MKFLILAISFFPLVAFGESKAPASFKTFITIEKVSENTSVEVKLPNDKKSRVLQTGKKYEIPVQMTRTNQFHVELQLVKDRLYILPCAIDVEQVDQYDRSYVCTAQTEKFPQVHVRVHTNLHGGDALTTQQLIAKK